MNVDFTKAFNKQFEKLPRKRQEKASAGGDLRLHFKIIGQKTILFVAVGSHAQLYK